MHVSRILLGGAATVSATTMASSHSHEIVRRLDQNPRVEEYEQPESGTVIACGSGFARDWVRIASWVLGWWMTQYGTIACHLRLANTGVATSQGVRESLFGRSSSRESKPIQRVPLAWSKDRTAHSKMGRGPCKDCQRTSSRYTATTPLGGGSFGLLHVLGFPARSRPMRGGQRQSLSRRRAMALV